VGCEFWAIQSADGVDGEFDFGVALTNGGSVAAAVNVTRGASYNETIVVPPSTSVIAFLPWVDALRRQTTTCNDGLTAGFGGSVFVASGAFHLVSDNPISAVQFSPVESQEYDGHGKLTGPPGKHWYSCKPEEPSYPTGTNDASLLLPAGALANTALALAPSEGSEQGATLSIAATMDGTELTVTEATVGVFQSGPGVAPGASAGLWSLTLNAGDVAQFATSAGVSADFSGATIMANAPISVISGSYVQHFLADCCGDHLESAGPPSNLVGSDYLVAAPPCADGTPCPYLARLLATERGTEIQCSIPSVCPHRLDVGIPWEVGPLKLDVHFFADAPFMVGTLSAGADELDPAGSLGDPSFVIHVPSSLYRSQYAFATPVDFAETFAMIVAPQSANLWLDGTLLSVPGDPIDGGFIARRVPIDTSSGLFHRLISDGNVGLVVTGYGTFSSYQYPAGFQSNAKPPPM
jgi:hypothetical protein